MNPFPFTPRDYQTTTRYRCNQILNDGGHPLIVLDTGLGKTKTLFMIIYDRVKLGKRIFVTVPNKEIFDQLLDEYSEFGLNPGYINSEGVRGKDRNLYICMFQSLFNNLSIIPESLYPDEIYHDEAHHSLCGSITDICDYFPKAQRLGMTATPLRLDNKPLGNLYTEIVNEIDIKEAIEKKYLTPPFLIAPDQYVDNIPMNESDFDVKVQADILGTPEIIGDVIETYSLVMNGLPCLVACSTHEHAIKVKKSFNEAGWIAEHIHSKLSDHERKSMTKRISSGETNVLCTVGVGIEGWSVDNLQCLIWLRRTMSVTIWKQFNGRVLRLKDGKEYGIIIDPVGNAVIHGFPDRVYHWNLTDGIDETDELSVSFKRCMDCGVYNAPDNIECHWCGADLSEEGKKEGTCRRCANWKKGECTQETDMFRACPIWLIMEGCSMFQRRGRSLPAMVDGKLVAITTDGEIQELRERTIKTKESIATRIQQEEEQKSSLEEINDFEKRKIISKGLFADQMQRTLFAEALEG